MRTRDSSTRRTSRRSPDGTSVRGRRKRSRSRPRAVLLQDFTGVPAVVDLAAMRDGIVRAGRRPAKGQPSAAGRARHRSLGAGRSLRRAQRRRPERRASSSARNRERYTFLRWGQEAFDNFRVVPPDTGIVHQVNLEYLARVIFSEQVDGRMLAYPDTLVGTDSHTTMVNGLGVVGWGVGGIEAEAAMLGPADLDADPRSRRVPARRSSARRVRPRPTSCSRSPSASASSVSSGSSSSSSARASSS